ncbi:MAG: hypothetical protein EBT86_01215 [Actinobacteria bacterium]|nr:hypothetical protein [Actinomycetota bacterium]
MRLLLYSGVLYLAGIALVLTLRPEFMFHSDGTWKEFGIGRNPDRYTWFPFWIFALVWAIVSYILIVFLASFNLLPGIEVLNDGTLVNNANISGLVYSSGDDAATTEEMRAVAEEMVEVPLKSPEVAPVIMDLNETNGSVRNQIRARVTNTATAPSVSRNRVAPTLNLRNGYYLLNAEATRRSGIPKYIYLGPEQPKVMYH